MARPKVIPNTPPRGDAWWPALSEHVVGDSIHLLARLHGLGGGIGKVTRLLTRSQIRRNG